MIWDQATINELKTFHAQGVDYVEIGRRLGCSKGAIAGKCKRLELEQRPLPTVKGGRSALVAMRGNDPNEERNRRILLMVNLSHRRCAKELGISRSIVFSVRKKHRHQITLETTAPAAQSPCRAVVAPPQSRAPTPALPPALRTFLAQPVRPPSSCQWPLGKRTSVYHTFRMCGCAEVVPGKPYCLPHAEQAYIRVKPRMEG